MEIEPIAYLDWAKRFIHDPELRNLAASGMATWSMADLEPAPHTLEIPTPNTFGLTELREAIAAHHGATVDQVLVTAGSSMANFLTVGSLVGTGDVALVEAPTYEPLRRLPALFGCRVETLVRPEDGWAVSREDLAHALDRTGATLVILTNPHNPSGVKLSEEAIQTLHAECHSRGATLLLDEVYAEFHEYDAAALGPATSESLVRISSLTKVMGFGPLRVGWAIATTDLVKRMVQLNDYAYVIHGGINERLAADIWYQRDRFVTHARERAAYNLDVVRRFMSVRDDLEWTDPGAGILGFVRVVGCEDTSPFVERLLQDHGVLVVPGRFFDRPAYFRLGFGGLPDDLRAGLTALGRALDAS